MTVCFHGVGVGLREGGKGGHELFEVALAGIALLAKAEIAHVAGLTNLFDVGVDGEPRVVENSGCGTGCGWRLDVEPVDLGVAVEPVASSNGLPILVIDLVFARPCAIKRTGGIGWNGTGDLEFDGRALLFLGLKLKPMYVRIMSTRTR